MKCPKLKRYQYKTVKGWMLAVQNVILHTDVRKLRGYDTLGTQLEEQLAEKLKTEMINLQLDLRHCLEKLELTINNIAAEKEYKRIQKNTKEYKGIQK